MSKNTHRRASISQQKPLNGGLRRIICCNGCQPNDFSFRRRRVSFTRCLFVLLSIAASLILLVWEGRHTENRGEQCSPFLSLAGVCRNYHNEHSLFYHSRSPVVFADATQSMKGDRDSGNTHDTQPLHSSSIQKKDEGDSSDNHHPHHAYYYYYDDDGPDEGYDDAILDGADEEEEESVKGKASRDEEKNKRWNGGHVQWFKDWAKAKEAARRERKPIFLQFWKEKDCPACSILERSVSKSMDVEVLSEYFIMLILPDTEAPDEEQFNVLPAYSPRTYFLNYKGRILDVINEFGGSPDHLHFYQNAEQLLSSMKEVLHDQSGFGTFRAI